MDMTAVPCGTFEMGDIIEKKNELLQANRSEWVNSDQDSLIKKS